MTTRVRLNFILFAVVAAGAGWLGVAIDRASGVELANGVAMSNSSGTTGQAVFILGPVVVALLLYFGSRDGAGKLGMTLKFRNRLAWFGAAAVFYPLITVISVGVGMALGVAALSVSPTPGKTGFLAAFLVLIPLQLVKNLFEELIFRGYGTRTAMALGLPGRMTPHLLVGAVWALWHVPLYLVWTSPADLALISTLSWPLFLIMLTVGIMATSIVYGEMRIQTGSIWPGIVLHTMCNAIATPLLVNGHLTFTGHGDVLASPVPSSLITMLLFLAAGTVLMRRGRSQPVVLAPRQRSSATARTSTPVT